MNLEMVFLPAVLISILRLLINKNEKKISSITGKTGQDGSYLAELLFL